MTWRPFLNTLSAQSRLGGDSQALQDFCPWTRGQRHLAVSREGGQQRCGPSHGVGAMNYLGGSSASLVLPGLGQLILWIRTKKGPSKREVELG